MRNRTKVNVFVSLVMASAYGLLAQQLTPAQESALRTKAVAMAQAQAAQSAAIAKMSSSALIEMTDDILPPMPDDAVSNQPTVQATTKFSKGGFAPMDNQSLPGFPGPDDGSGDGSDTNVSGGLPDGLAEPIITPDPYQFFGLPPFQYWQTITQPTWDYPWVLDPYSGGSIYGTNGPGVESYPNTEPTLWTRSVIFISVTNDIDSFGDPMAHQLNFWYLYSTPAPYNDLFKCSIAFIPGDNGVYHTNLPPTDSWRRVSCLVPPYSDNTTLYFTVYRQSLLVNQVPYAHLDPSVQWWFIPKQASDLQVGINGDGNAQVQWNTYAYPTNKWFLSFAQDVTGPFSSDPSDIGTPVTMSNNIAIAVFPATNVSRFYLLRHY